MQDKIPNKLTFSAGSPERRKRTFLLSGILVVLQICLIWPVYPVFSSPGPLFLGLPLSFLWVILVLLIAFGTMLIYYQFDKEGD